MSLPGEAFIVFSGLYNTVLEGYFEELESQNECENGNFSSLLFSNPALAVLLLMFLLTIWDILVSFLK